MSLEKVKADLHKLIDQINDEEALKDLRTEAKKSISWWEKLTDEQRSEIKESMAEADAGKLTPHEEVMKKYKKWL